MTNGGVKSSFWKWGGGQKQIFYLLKFLLKGKCGKILMSIFFPKNVYSRLRKVVRNLFKQLNMSKMY